MHSFQKIPNFSEKKIPKDGGPKVSIEKEQTQELNIQSSEKVSA